MAPLYGTQVGIGARRLIAAILLVQFVGIPFTFLFGLLAVASGRARRSSSRSSCTRSSACSPTQMTTAARLLRARVRSSRSVQGGSQALSRSLFASMIPRQRSSEFFGFFSVFEKFAGIFGPLIFALAVGLTGSSRSAILSMILFFVVGGLTLSLVDVDAGQRAAAAADAEGR